MRSRRSVKRRRHKVFLLVSKRSELGPCTAENSRFGQSKKPGRNARGYSPNLMIHNELRAKAKRAASKTRQRAGRGKSRTGKELDKQIFNPSQGNTRLPHCEIWLLEGCASEPSEKHELAKPFKPQDRELNKPASSQKFMRIDSMTSESMILRPAAFSAPALRATNSRATFRRGWRNSKARHNSKFSANFKSGVSLAFSNLKSGDWPNAEENPKAEGNSRRGANWQRHKIFLLVSRRSELGPCALGTCGSGTPKFLNREAPKATLSSPRPELLTAKAKLSEVQNYQAFSHRARQSETVRFQTSRVPHGVRQPRRGAFPQGTTAQVASQKNFWERIMA